MISSTARRACGRLVTSATTNGANGTRRMISQQHHQKMLRMVNHGCDRELMIRANAGFASGKTRMFSSAADHLAGRLQAEYNEEVEREDEAADLENLLGDTNFTIDKKQSQQSYFVLRNGNVTVEFEATEYEHSDETVSAVPFEVVITKPEAKKELIFDCIAQYDGNIEDHELLLEGIVVKDLTKPDEDSPYSPSFAELEDTVQESFFDYLQEHGVDRDLAASIIAMAEQEEQRTYVKWLKEVREFVQK